MRKRSIPEVPATPQNPALGAIARAVRKAQEFAGQYEVDPRVPLLGGTSVDELLRLPGAASLMEDVSYYGPRAAIRGGNVATGGIGTFRLDPRVADVADVATVAVPAGKAAVTGGLGMVKRATDVNAIRDYIRATGAPGTPMVVWHGSPHKFERFDASKIGTGEGAQAYGHGLYLAQTPEVAGSYIQAGRNVGFENWDDPIRLANKAFGNAGGDTAKAMALLDDAISSAKPGSRKNNLIFAKRVLERGDQTAGLYKVDLPDEKIARMLDWDKPLSHQPEVYKQLKGLKLPHGDSLAETMKYREGISLKDAFGNDVEKVITDAIGLRSDTASALQSRGIPGIRYLDQASRGTGAGTSNFVVFPGEEQWLKILERNGIPIPPGYAGGGIVRGAAEALQKMLTRAPAKSKQEIEAIAERIAPQVTGEYVRIKPESAVTVAGKTKKQFQKEKTLPVDVRARTAEKTPKTVGIETQKGDVMIGIPGDPTITGKDLYSVGETVLERPSPQFGGPLYGLYHDKDHFWASGLGAARRVQNLAREASEQYGAPVIGKYVMMGPESINYAQHFADANLQAIDLSKMTKRQVEGFNKLIRQGSPKSGPRPSFPGIEDKDAAYLHLAEDPELRKHFNALMQQNTVVEAFNLPSGQDIRYAITEPSLRDLETGVTGHSMGRMRAEIPSTELKLSEHPTYSHDIPGEFLGSSRYPIPYELSFPDTLKAIRENPLQAPQEFGSLKMVGPRQIIDQQLIDEIKTYEDRMKALTGKKKGGAVKKYASGGLVKEYNPDQISALAAQLEEQMYA
jgi:hypothetical protein